MAQDAAYYKAQVRRDVGDSGKNAVFDIVFPVETQGGNFALSVGGASNDAMSYPHNAAGVQTNLAEQETVGADSVLVESRNFSGGRVGYRISFIGDLGARPGPTLTADGSDLYPVNDIAVQTIEAGAFPHFTDTRIAEMWDARSAFEADIYLQYLWTRYDVITELKGIVWTQVNQQTGDARRDYAEQYKHLIQMEESTLEAIDRHLSGANVVASVPQGQPLFGEIARKTPSGGAYRFPSGSSRGLY